MPDEFYPPVGFHFKVDFHKLPKITEGDCRFQDVSGLSVDVETEEIREGGENRFVYKLPKGVKYPKLVLKRGVLRNSGVITWIRDAIEKFEFSPCSLTVSLLNEEHDPLISWVVIGAWPLKWSVSEFKASENALAAEIIELNYKYFKRYTPKIKKKK